MRFSRCRLARPGLGFAAAALRSAGPLVAVAALGPLTFVDPEEITLLLSAGRDLPVWVAIAAAVSLAIALAIGIGSVVLLQIAFTYLPPLEFLYDTRPIDWPDMGVAALAAIGLILVLELEKAIRLGIFGAGRA